LAINQYTKTEKWLHWLALSSNAIPETAFQVEKMRFGRHLPKDNGRHVFVAGLARSGTTMLMRLLYETGGFCSLTYRDMPFVLCPNSWHQIVSLSSRRNRLQERAHGDGLMVDYDSPEALEEVFWRTFSGTDYIRHNCLLSMTAGQEEIEDFRTYVGLILFRYGKQRYLSKNNNNILRLPSLLEAFPNARILVPFRHPLAQSQSLLAQHRRFVREGCAEPFVTRYMGWLAHYEFGPDHRPFLKPQSKAESNRTDELEYWLDLWLTVYQWLLDRTPDDDRLMFVNYETLCRHPTAMWQSVANRLALNAEPSTGLTTIKESHAMGVEYGIPEGYKTAESVYRKLLDRALQPAG